MFVTPFGFFHIHLPSAFFWNMEFMILNVLDDAHSTEVSPLSFLNSNLPVDVSIGFVLFPVCALKSPMTIV